MIDNLKITCSKKYEDNIKKVFENISICKEEKTIIINDKFKCNFNPNLYVEQRILRCLRENNIDISDSDKIILAKSLIKKTKRFLLDTDLELFKDFQYLINTNRERLYIEMQSLIDKPYADHLFEAEIFKTINLKNGISIITIKEDTYLKYKKDIDDILKIIFSFPNIKDAKNWLIVNKFSERKDIIYMLSLEKDFKDFPCSYAKEYNEFVVKIDLNETFNCKQNKCIKDFEEYLKID